MMKYKNAIYVSDDAKKKIEEIKIHPNQSNGEVIDKILGIDEKIMIKDVKHK